jgi:hypothetical protein
MDFQAYKLKNHPEWACIQVKAPESSERTPIHLCCVIDTSGSMEMDYKLDNVKRSLQFLLDYLGPNDKLSIVTFSEVAKVIINQVAVVVNEKDNIRTRISIIQSESNTNLSAGIIAARDCLLTDTSHIKQGVLVLTDGHANMGLMRAPDILDLVRNTIRGFGGTSFSCIGYGGDHNVDLLESISSEGGGSYYVVNNLEDVAVVFGNILGGLVSCTFQQVSISIPNASEIKSRYAMNIGARGTDIIIGDLPAGMEAAFLAKLPVGTKITLRAYDLVTHSGVNITRDIEENETLQLNGDAHFIRFVVLELIDGSRTLLNRGKQDAINRHIALIDEHIQKIEEHKREHVHSLWDILLEELRTCKLSLQRRDVYDEMSPQILTQRRAYLGMMRGVPASMSQVREDSPFPDTTPTLERTFSNPVQRQISSQLYTSVTPIAVNRRRTRADDPTSLAQSQNGDMHDSTSSMTETPEELSPILRCLASPIRRVPLRTRANT